MAILSKKQYEKLCADSESLDVYDGRGTYDVYECKACGHHIVTTYAVKGVTPFTMRCPKCGKTMMHTQTLKEAPAGEKVIKWVRPSYRRYRKLPDFLREHIEQGGLILESETI